MLKNRDLCKVMMKKGIILGVMAACSLLFLGGCGSGTAEQAQSLPIDETIGLGIDFVYREELSYAHEFALDYYENGYTLITISDGSRFLPVSKGESVPEGLDPDICVIEKPLENIYLAGSATMDIFRALDAINTIRLSGMDADGWYIEEAAEAMKSGEILYAGKYNAPDYELILSEECSLAIENTMIFHVPEVQEQLEGFGIPVLVDHSSYESHPLGRVEWIKLYGALLGKEQEAEDFFEGQEAVLQEIGEAQSTGKTVVFFYVTANGGVNVRRATDYIPKMIELAGGEYIFDELGDEDSKTSSMTLQMEEFYAVARDADYLIYNSNIDGELGSLEELLDKNGLFADFKAVQEGNVWCTRKNLYQESTAIGGMIGDFHRMLAEEESEMQFLYRLK